jgi:hypothetical protein
MRRPFAFAFAVLCGCATTAPEGGPRGLRASDHLEAAREHSEAAANRARWPEPGAQPGTPGPPWFYYWQAGGDERLAELHRSAAARLESEYQDACGQTPQAVASVSPLVRFAIGGSPIADGAVVYLSSDAGTPEQLLAAMRCHRAWMMLGRSAMDDCPLDLPGIEIVAHQGPGAIEVSITTRDAAQVPELQRRVAKDVEAAASHTLHGGMR